MTSFDLLIKRAETALAAGDYKACHQHAIAAIGIDATRAEPYFLLGVIAADHQNHPKALELFDRAIAAAPDGAPYRARSRAQRAKLLTLANRDGDAAAEIDRAIAEKPSDAHTLDTIGVVLTHIGRHKDAVPFFQQAVALAPDNSDYCYNLGSALQFDGAFDAAETAFRRSLKTAPNKVRTYSSLASLRRQTEDHNYIAPMEALFKKSANADDRLHLGHALAKSCEDLERYDKALNWLVAAKEKKRVELGYKFATDAAIFDAAENTEITDIAQTSAKGPLSPIFIIGMPRTGTTLIDRILSSHPSIISMGELTHFGLILKKSARTPSPYVLDAATLEAAGSLDLRTIGKAYLDQTARLRGSAQGFVDKMPLNFFYAPAILAAMPEARIITLRRNPMDACLSNFRQLFSTSYSYYNYSYDFEDTARYYARFDQLCTHWRETLPQDRYMEIQYEDVVTKQEEETRKLISFTGFPWDDICLAFHNNASPVATASSVQVRQPIYTSSIGRWRRYGDGIAPLKHALEEAGIETE